MICDCCLSILAPYEVAVADQVVAAWRSSPLPLPDPALFCERCTRLVLEFESDGWAR